MYSTAKASRYSGITSLLTPAIIFVLSTMIVNGGNYLYNLILGRVLSPSEFSHVGLLITLLLVMSFLAMTFQIASTKYTIELENEDKYHFQNWISKIGRNTGVVFGMFFLLLGNQVANFFKLPSANPVYLFALGLPFFFTMSVHRGFLQGKEDFLRLSGSYQSEMWVRMLITFSLIFLFNLPADISVSVAITASVIAGYWITKHNTKFHYGKLAAGYTRPIVTFILFTAAYEGTQILINYCDILIVKHHFDNESAGLYTSMALIGRIIYFMTWMIVMILIPKVLLQKKQGLAHRKTLLKYVALIVGFSFLLIIGCNLFHREIVTSLFGAAYLSVSSLLWKYALATMLFAVANLFVYYFLCLDQKTPVFLACFFGISQVVFLATFYDSLNQVVGIQILNMSALLMSVILFYLFKEYAPSMNQPSERIKKSSFS